MPGASALGLIAWFLAVLACAAGAIVCVARFAGTAPPDGRVAAAGAVAFALAWVWLVFGYDWRALCC